MHECKETPVRGHRERLRRVARFRPISRALLPRRVPERMVVAGPPPVIEVAGLSLCCSLHPRFAKTAKSHANARLQPRQRAKTHLRREPRNSELVNRARGTHSGSPQSQQSRQMLPASGSNAPGSRPSTRRSSAVKPAPAELGRRRQLRGGAVKLATRTRAARRGRRSNRLPQRPLDHRVTRSPQIPPSCRLVLWIIPFFRTRTPMSPFHPVPAAARGTRPARSRSSFRRNRRGGAAPPRRRGATRTRRSVGTPRGRPRRTSAAARRHVARVDDGARRERAAGQERAVRRLPRRVVAARRVVGRDAAPATHEHSFFVSAPSTTHRSSW